MRIQRFGWRKDRLDPRDRLFTPSAPILPLVDLRTPPFMPPVYDQGQLGSCTANAIASAIQFERRKQGLSDFIPSRLMIYYDERKMEGTVNSDAGAEIRDGIKSVGIAGACPESEWPYDISQFAVAPPNQAYLDALKDRAVQYLSIDNTKLDDLKSCLSEGYPIVFGVTLYQVFEETKEDGIVPTPSTGLIHKMFESPIGGHAMKIVGYDDRAQRFFVKNSWGDAWGDHGYCYMGYDYLTNDSLASDFWTIRLISP